jgi:hypothetical protein
MLSSVSLVAPSSPCRGPTLMQSIGGLPSFQKDKTEDYGGIEFQALLIEGGAKLELAKVLFPK